VQTWVQLGEAAKRLARKDGSKFTRQGMKWAMHSPQWTVIKFNPILIQCGGQWFDASGKCTINSPAGVKAMTIRSSISRQYGADDPADTIATSSGIISVLVMASNVVFCTLAGYGLAKFRFPGDEIVLLAILSTLMLPLEVTLVLTFLVIHKFGWMNTYQGVAGPLLIEAFGVFLMRQAILTIPSDYIEAARIDGAGEVRILGRIIVPQVIPALAVLAVLSFRDSWDQFLWLLTAISKDAMRTFLLGLVQFGEDHGNPPTEQMAIAVLATIPTFLLFVLLQRWVNRGFGLSGLK
jgi:multiple sugar transport system permease protein